MDPRLTPRTRIKICGITRERDALAAVEAGADAVGFVFYRKSPRAVTPEVAARLIRLLPPFVTAVGLFVDAPEAEIRATLAKVPLGLLQFHGDESQADCARYGTPWIKVLRVRPEVDLLQYAASHAGAAGLLLDAFRPGVPGGTGQSFDWSLVPPALPVRVVLSGGLTPESVGEGIGRIRPWAVDVSSGVESAPGIKDALAIARFVAAVRSADGG